MSIFFYPGMDRTQGPRSYFKMNLFLQLNQGLHFSLSTVSPQIAFYSERKATFSKQLIVQNESNGIHVWEF